MDNFNTLDLAQLKKGDLKLDGLGGENSVLIYDLLNSLFGLADNALNQKDGNGKHKVMDEIRKPLNSALTNAQKASTNALHKFSSLIPSLPKLLGDMGLEGMVA
jgi:hypothetical protein